MKILNFVSDVPTADVVVRGYITIEKDCGEW